MPFGVLLVNLRFRRDPRERCMVMEPPTPAILPNRAPRQTAVEGSVLSIHSRRYPLHKPHPSFCHIVLCLSPHRDKTRTHRSTQHTAPAHKSYCCASSGASPYRACSQRQPLGERDRNGDVQRTRYFVSCFAFTLFPQVSITSLQPSNPSGTTGGAFSFWNAVTAGRGPCQ